MPTEYRGVWIRIAGNSKRIKDNTPPPHWRYEIEGQPGQHLLMGWILHGEATDHNNSQDTRPTAKGHEFLAWVRYYGDVVISDDRSAIITLLPVPLTEL